MWWADKADKVKKSENKMVSGGIMSIKIIPLLLS